MVTFEIKTGTLLADGQIIGHGYAGNGDCLNNPEMCAMAQHGPLPTGFYVIGQPIDQPKSTGAYSLPLWPDISNQMFGRNGFFVHGDNPEQNQTASDGCIVTGRDVREVIAKHQILQVVEGE